MKNKIVIPIITLMIVLGMLGYLFKDDIGFEVVGVSAMEVIVPQYGNAICRVDLTTTISTADIPTPSPTGKLVVPIPVDAATYTIHIKVDKDAEGILSTIDDNKLFYQICRITGCEEEKSIDLYQARLDGKCGTINDNYCNLEISDIDNRYGVQTKLEYWDMKIGGDRDELIDNGFEYYITYNPIYLEGETAQNFIITNLVDKKWGCDVTKLSLPDKEFFGVIIANSDSVNTGGTCTTSECFYGGTYNWIGFYTPALFIGDSAENIIDDEYVCEPLIDSGTIKDLGEITYKIGDTSYTKKILGNPVQSVTCCPSMSTTTQECKRVGTTGFTFEWVANDLDCPTGSASECPGGGSIYIETPGNPYEKCLYTCSGGNCVTTDCYTKECLFDSDCGDIEGAICYNGECKVVDPCLEHPELCEQCVEKEDCAVFGENYDCVNGTCIEKPSYLMWIAIGVLGAIILALIVALLMKKGRGGGAF